MFDIKALNLGNNTGEILVYGDIVDTSWERWSEEDITPKMFNDALQSLGNVSDIRVRLNCYGGSCFAGRTMGAMLQNKKKDGVHITTIVEGVAASMAGVLLQYGDKRVMWSGTHLMLHKPLNKSVGNADTHRKNADLLDKIEDALIKAYMQHYIGSEEELRAILREETWYEAEEALALGLCSEVEGVAEVAAHAFGFRFGDLVVPNAYLGNYADKIKTLQEKGGENTMYDKVTDAKIKSLLDAGKFVSLGKDGEVCEMAEAELESAVEFLTAEQVQALGIENVTGEMILTALTALDEAGIVISDVAAGLATLGPKDAEAIAKAERYDAIFSGAVQEALKNGVRAKSDKFDSSRWEKALSGFSLDEVNAQSEEWANEAERELHVAEGKLSRTPTSGGAYTANPEDYKL